MKLPVITPRDAAKYLVSGVITVKADTIATNYMVDHTRFEKDDIVVKLGAGLLAAQAGAMLSPVTDRIVDAAADFIVAQREAWEAKKDATKKPEI